MSTLSNEKTDKRGYDQLYRGKVSRFADSANKQAYVEQYERSKLTPFYAGGRTKGYARGLATRSLLDAISRKGLNPADTLILDAGSGQGELSVYLGCKGYNVVGVDISESGCLAARDMAARIGVSKNCSFLAQSLDSISIGDGEVDYIIGHAALHHFIKYEGVPNEFKRVMKDASEGFFADSFGENKVYHLFHNKERMKRLGDVSLSKDMIVKYFRGFNVELLPADWFTMTDKLFMKIFPRNWDNVAKRISGCSFWLDRHIPVSSRFALRLSGSVVTTIRKC
jgi:ubiquinone/menaquinone biosynthesis C-methylase UbiE